MSELAADTLRYPTGKYTAQEAPRSQEELKLFIGRIESLPAKVEAAIHGLSAKQLDTPYRDGGWTVRQVLHHLPESHLNAYIRFKWALTEDTPTIKAYNEKAWAQTPETSLDPGVSVQLLKALHAKWVTLLNSLSPADLQRGYVHPETKKFNRLDNVVGMYAWHGEHHLAHITSLKQRMGW